MTCCDEVKCRRKHPILIRQGYFSGDWVAITRYVERDGGLIEAQEKHTLPGPTQAEIELNGSVLRDLRSWMQSERDSASGAPKRAAMTAVLDKIDALADEKLTALGVKRKEATT